MKYKVLKILHPHKTIIIIGLSLFALLIFHKLGPLACSAGWFLNGVSCYKENNKDTWEGARKECTASGGDLVKINNARDEKHRFLIQFMEINGLKKMNIDVSNESITL